jgi:hypothetical protein
MLTMAKLDIAALAGGVFGVDRLTFRPLARLTSTA